MKNSKIFNEQNLQNIFIDDLKKNNWKQLTYQQVNEDFNIQSQKDVILKNIFISSLQRINKNKKLSKKLFEIFYQQIVQEMNNYHFDSSIDLNEIFIKYLRQGRRINEALDENNERPLIYLIDQNNFDNNVFHFICEFKNGDKYKNRADIVLFINGLPIIVFELKSIIKGSGDIWEAWQQLKNYHQDYHQLFAFNLFSVISNEADCFYGSIFSEKNYWKQWKKSRCDQKYLQFADLNRSQIIESDQNNLNLRRETFMNGILNHKTIHDFILHFIFFKKVNHQRTKIIAYYHQYYSALNAFEKIKQNKKKVGIIHHTQGSGKTITMIFLSHLIQKLTNYIVFLITDRVKLDNQLFERFKVTENYFLSHSIKKIETKINLLNSLKTKKDDSHGIFISTLQKFNEKISCLSEREDILIIADEAHRSQYNYAEFNVFNSNFEKNFGFAKFLRTAFPHASFLGFTATPIDLKERSTIKVFGDVLLNDVYDMNQSINDKTTVPLTYCFFPIFLKTKKISEKLIPEKNLYKISQYHKEINTDHLFVDLDRIEKVFSKFKQKYLQDQNKLFGKALFVSRNRKIAWCYFKRMNRDPFFKNKVALIISKDKKDGAFDQEMRQYLKDIKIKEQINNFEEPKSKIKIAIVCDMLLTGFDMPHLDQIYLDKELENHNLYQAIGRVNRIYPKKNRGIIVSFFDLEQKIKDAISKFSNDHQNKNQLSVINSFTNNDDLIKNVSQKINQLYQFISQEDIENIFQKQIYFNFLNNQKNWKNFTWEHKFNLLNNPLKQKFIEAVLEKLVSNLKLPINQITINNNKNNQLEERFYSLCDQLKNDYIYIYFNNSLDHLSLKTKGLFFCILFISWKKIFFKHFNNQNKENNIFLTKEDKTNFSFLIEKKIIPHSQNLFPTNKASIDQKYFNQISEEDESQRPHTLFRIRTNQSYSNIEKAKKRFPVSYKDLEIKLQKIIKKYNDSLISKNSHQKTLNALDEITNFEIESFEYVKKSQKDPFKSAFEDILKTNSPEFAEDQENLNQNISIIINVFNYYNHEYQNSWIERKRITSKFKVELIKKIKKSSPKIDSKKIFEKTEIILKYIKNN